MHSQEDLRSAKLADDLVLRIRDALRHGSVEPGALAINWRELERREPMILDSTYTAADESTRHGSSPNDTERTTLSLAADPHLQVVAACFDRTYFRLFPIFIRCLRKLAGFKRARTPSPR